MLPREVETVLCLENACCVLLSDDHHLKNGHYRNLKTSATFVTNEIVFAVNEH